MAQSSSISLKIKEVSSRPCDKVLSEQFVSAGSDKEEVDFLEQSFPDEDTRKAALEWLDKRIITYQVMIELGWDKG